MGSAEREAERLDAPIQKLDLELAVDDRPLLPDQLIGALFGHNAAALLIDVSAVRRTGRLPVEANDKARGVTAPCRSHDEVDISRMKSIVDLAVWLLQRDGLAAERPIACERPFFQSQARGVADEVLRLLRRAKIRLARFQVVPIRRCFNPSGVRGHYVATEGAGPCPGFDQHLLNVAL